VINMEPVLKRGYTAWDRALLPQDEFGERVRAVQAALREAGLGALVVLGNAYEYADFAYLAGSPTGGAVVVTPEGDPALITSSGGRELPFLSTLTWITAVTPSGGYGFGGMGKSLRALLEERGVPPGPIGAVGTHLLPAAAYSGLVESLAGWEPREFDAALRALRARRRPREVAAVSTALGIATAAAAAAERAFAGGASNARALVEAERVARQHRARDFRALANIASDDLRPYEGLSDDRRAPLALWLAVEYQGYWAELAVTSPAPPASEAARAVEAMIRAARAGGEARDVARAALSALSPAGVESALAYGLGNGIGLALGEAPTITPTSDETLVESALLSLRALSRGAGTVSFASAIVQVGPDGAARLTPRALAGPSGGTA
jgi:Xaa-Pro aminopeptidase